MLNQYTVHMYYSTPKTGSGAQDGRQQDSWARSDWICSKCGAHNFKRRDYCFKCSISKEESERAKEGDGFDQVGNNPCNTLIFRGLDALTTEENIVAVLSRVCNLSIKNMKVMRDATTNTSRGFGFVELHSIQDSSMLLDSCKNMAPFEIDGKAIMVSYAKNTFTTTMATLSSAAATTAAQSYTDYYENVTATSNTTAPYYDATSGQYYDPTTGQYYDYATYYAQLQQQQAQTQQAQAGGKADTNTAAAVAQAAIQQAQAAKHYHKQAEDMQKQLVTQMQQQQNSIVEASQTPQYTSETGESTEYQTYPEPDVSTYQFDESSGYYYDPTTQLYYDANSQYYYNSTTNQFMYWDGEKKTYLPAPTEGIDANGDKNQDKTKKEKADKKEKVKIAKKIAKDMEKWAKTLNAQKEAMKDGFKKSFQPIGARGEERESASADAGFAVLEKKAVADRKGIDINLLRNDKKAMPPPAAGGRPGAPPTLVASYGDSDEEEDDSGDVSGLSEDKLVDLTKMACLLCKRQFPNKDGLLRHQKMSDLHKKNLEELRAKNAQAAANAGSQYRDRAKERRQKYGVPEPPQPKRGRDAAAVATPTETYEQPNKAGIQGNNIGNKMLQKMGWSAGQGLGKAGQGITDPVEAMKRQSQAGLGARGASYNVNPGDTYKDSVKKVMYARFNELE